MNLFFRALVFLCLSSLSWAQFLPNIPTPSIAGSGQHIYTITEGRIRYSTDGGQDWTIVQMPGNPSFKRIAIDPVDPRTAWAAGDLPDVGVYRTTNAGATWAPMNNGLPDAGEALKLFTARNRAGLVYFRIGNQVYKTDDAGDTWTHQSTLPGPVTDSGTQLTINVTNPNVWYCAPSLRDLKVDTNNVFRSIDEGATWQARAPFQVAGAPSTIHALLSSIASSPLDPNIVFVGVNSPTPVYGGVFRSTDGGANFTKVDGLYAISLLIDLNGNVFSATFAALGSYRRSTDNGASFTTLQGGSSDFSVVSFALDFSSPNTLYTGGASGPYRSLNAGQSWTLLTSETQGTLDLPPAIDLSYPEGDYDLNYNLSLRFMEDAEWESDYTASLTGGDWAVLDKTSGSIPETLKISVSTAGLPIGDYTATLEIRCDFECKGSPVEVSIVLHIVDPDSLEAPPYKVSTFAGNPALNEVRDGVPATETFLIPRDMDVDPQGRLLIADRENFRIFRVNLDNTIEIIGGTGAAGIGSDGANVRTSPIDASRIVADPDGGFWFRDEANRELRHADADGMLSTIPGFHLLDGLAADPAGNLYVARNGRVFKIAPDGTQTEIPHGNLDIHDTNAIAVGPDGSVYVALFSERIYRVTPNGQVEHVSGAGDGEGSRERTPMVATLANHSFPRALDVDEAGNIFFGDIINDSVRMVDPTGIIYTLVSEDSDLGDEVAPDFPWAAVAGPDGVIYVSEFRGNVVHKLTPVRPTILEGGIGNASSGLECFSPGALISIYGDFGAETGTPSAFPWPTMLNGVRVTLNGRPMPISYTSANQINVQVPYETELGDAVLVVSVNGIESLAVAIHIDPASPGIIQFGAGRAVAVNAAGTDNPGEINTDATPVRPGGYVVVYLTGIGVLTNPVGTGEVAPDSPFSEPATAPVTIMIGDRTVPYDFLGLSPGWVALAQLNLPIPADLADGNYTIKITIGDKSSNTPVISIRQ